MRNKNKAAHHLLTSLRELYISSLPTDEQIKLRVQLLKEKASQIIDKEPELIIKILKMFKK